MPEPQAAAVEISTCSEAQSLGNVITGPAGLPSKRRCGSDALTGGLRKKASGVRAKSGFPMLDISALSTQRVPSFLFGGTQSPNAPEIVEKAMSNGKADVRRK